MGAATRYLQQRYSMPYAQVKAMLTDVGTEELGHTEMISSIIYQLTRCLPISEIKKSGFDAYFVDHTTGVYPQGASGMPFSTSTLQVTGDTIADLTEDLAAEQKARLSYDNILRLIDDPDVRDPIIFLREREVVHFQRFGESLRITQDNLDSRNFYAFNPSFDRKCNPPDIAPVAPAPSSVAGISNMPNVPNTAVCGISEKFDDLITAYKNLDMSVYNVSEAATEKPKENIAPKVCEVAMEKPKENPKVSEVAMEKPKENPKVSEVAMEKPKENPKVSGVTMEKPKENPKVSEVAMEKPKENPKVSGVTMEKPKENPKVSEVAMEKPKENPKVSEVAMEKPKENPKVSGVTMEKPKENPKVSGVTMEKPKENPKVSEVAMEKPKENPKVSGVTMEKPKVNDWTNIFNQDYHAPNYGYNAVNPFGYNPAAKKNKRNYYGNG